MHGFIAGITDSDNISYCPKCGQGIKMPHGDGTARCDGCRFHFGVVECEEEFSKEG